MEWPPQVGDLLPRAELAFGMRSKLATYSLAWGHSSGGGKAKGFERILGITIDDLDHLEAEIRKGIRTRPIVSTRTADPFGVTCVVDCPVQGLGLLTYRVVPARTSWIYPDRTSAPRLTSAYLKP